ncbi:tetratricopeptide repeat protein [Saccharothrix carnea]|uniref:Tetratricopeptide repeat protein n=1 Tax=Saccharothrix carnea TaxID=1280637 RepID=A0A2P8I186_SACCR|nr:tetratricopeptide repeat protein [Saccharothrix carnea]PSL52230.1 tetratricopeptide repeat protein [Saccharothrix carnea]
MPERSTSRNALHGVVNGSVVQVGSADHVTVAAEEAQRLPVPRQLPAAVGDFTGRAAHLAALDAVAARAADKSTGGAVITTVAGTAGVGKTTLALHWAHRAEDGFPDGTLYADLRGYGPGEPATAGEVLHRFLCSLGVRPRAVPIGEEARADLYRSLLAGSRVLVVLDNAGTSEQVRPLVPGGRGCLVVVTSRAALRGLHVSPGATPLTVDVMTERESVDLIRRMIGPRRAGDEPDGVVRLARVCAGLPLALRITGSRLTSRPDLGVGDVVAEMTDDRLEVLSAAGIGTFGVTHVFDRSFRVLTAEQARLFRRLGLHPGLDIGVQAVAAVAGVPVDLARRLLDDLAEVHLVEPVARGRFRCHDLLRDYALDRARRLDPVAVRAHASAALFEWYAHNAAAADRLAFPAYVHRVPAFAGPPAARPVPTTRTDSLEWFEAESANLVALIRSAATTHSRWVVRLVHATETFLYHHARWDELFDVCVRGITAARQDGDRAGEAWFLIRSGWARLQVSGWERAAVDLRAALALAREVDDPYLIAYALNDLGDISLRRGRYAEALAHLGQALPLSRGTDDGRQEAFVRTNCSRALAGLGRYDQALDHAERALELRRRADDREGAVFTLNQLARVWQALGDHRRAIALCDQAIGIGPEHAYHPDIAAALDTSGTSAMYLGDVDRARKCWSAALGILSDFGDHRAAELRTRLRGVGHA